MVSPVGIIDRLAVVVETSVGEMATWKLNCLVEIIAPRINC